MGKELRGTKLVEYTHMFFNEEEGVWECNHTIKKDGVEVMLRDFGDSIKESYENHRKRLLRFREVVGDSFENVRGTEFEEFVTFPN